MVPPREIEVLLIEDDQEDALLTRAALAEASNQPYAPARFAVSHVKSLATATTELATRFDIILLDLQLPDAAGMDLVRAINDLQPQAPIVVLTGAADDSLGRQAVREGAQDFLTKGVFNAAALGKAILFAIERQQLKSKLQDSTEQLAVSEARLNRIVANSVDAILIVDTSGVVLFANPAAEALFDGTDQDLIGHSLTLSRKQDNAEIEVVRQNGAICIAEIRTAAIEWQGVKATLMTLRDITAHKEMLRQLDETKSRQLTMRDRFLSQVSHELRTPLTVSQQYTDLLLDGLLGAITEEQREALRKVRRSGRYLEKMIEDLLEATRSDTGKLVVNTRRTSLAELLPEVMASAQSAIVRKELTYDTVVPSQLGDVLADPGRLRQILGNLLGNAAKFTPNGGSITLTIDYSDAYPDHVCFAVKDTGCGIPGDERELIFKPLYQRDVDPELSRKGLGLGLHICSQLVHSQGGQIWVESEEGAGSTFFFTLPVFSLRSILAAMPRAAAGATEFCLLSLAVRHTAGSQPALGLDKNLDRVRREVTECLMPDRDFLLPRVAFNSEGELAFILATSNIDGAEILSQRIIDQIAACPVIQSARLKTDISLRAITLPPEVGKILPSTLARRQAIARTLLPELQDLAATSGYILDLPGAGPSFSS